MSTASRLAPPPHQIRRAELRRRVGEIKAKRDARDAEIGERLRREQAGQKGESIEALRRRLGFDDGT